MKINSNDIVTIPIHVRKSIGIIPSETEVEFLQDDKGDWYISKIKFQPELNRFRTAHKLFNHFKD